MFQAGVKSHVQFKNATEATLEHETKRLFVRAPELFRSANLRRGRAADGAAGDRATGAGASG